MESIEYQKRIKLATGLLTAVLLIVIISVEAALRLVAISHTCTLNTTDFIAHRIALHYNQSEFSLRILDN